MIGILLILALLVAFLIYHFITEWQYRAYCKELEAWLAEHPLSDEEVSE